MEPVDMDPLLLALLELVAMEILFTEAEQVVATLEVEGAVIRQVRADRAIANLLFVIILSMQQQRLMGMARS
jgi:hypothetical protein